MLALPDGVAAVVASLATIRTAIGVPVNPAQSRAEATPLLAAVAPRVVIVAHGDRDRVADVAMHANIPVVAVDTAGDRLPGPRHPDDREATTPSRPHRMTSL